MNNIKTGFIVFGLFTCSIIFYTLLTSLFGMMIAGKDSDNDKICACAWCVGGLLFEIMVFICADVYGLI